MVEIGLGDPNLRFCKAHSWAEARYVVTAYRSFKDILYSKNGWPLLYGIMIELFGNESAFIVGPELLKELREVANPSPSLRRVIARESVPPPSLANLRPEPIIPLPPHPSPANTTPEELSEQQRLEIYRQNAIDLDVQMRMIVLDYAVDQREADYGVRHEVQVLSRIVDRLSERVSNLTIGSENVADD
ncbi:hypothetical protein FRC09_015995 [Ceratobasidium sp. 395]|nr:hypothetical protein FRC09_015995 [Ceratobasidium sp. 395]